MTSLRFIERNIERLLLRPKNRNTPCDCILTYLSLKFSDVTAPSRYCYCIIAVNKGAVTATSRGSTIADLALTTTRQPDPWIPWSRLTHTLPCHTLILIVWVLVCATAPPVRSPAKVTAILKESVTAVTASRFSPVNMSSSIAASHASGFVQYRISTRHSSLTHWGRDKMAAISQTTLSNTFSWMKL